MPKNLGSFSNNKDIPRKQDIPASLSDLSDDSTHRTVTDTEKTAWSNKQNSLVSGTNIKTINGENILGSGDIPIRSGMFSTETRRAILNCFAHVAWIDEHGQDYYDYLEELLFSNVHVESLTAVYAPGDFVVRIYTTLDELRPYLTVTATYEDETTEVLRTYSLSGQLQEGTNIITVDYLGATTTFSVVVQRREVLLISGYGTQSGRASYVGAAPYIWTNTTYEYPLDIVAIGLYGSTAGTLSIGTVPSSQVVLNSTVNRSAFNIHETLQISTGYQKIYLQNTMHVTSGNLPFVGMNTDTGLFNYGYTDSEDKGFIYVGSSSGKYETATNPVALGINLYIKE